MPTTRTQYLVLGIDLSDPLECGVKVPDTLDINTDGFKASCENYGLALISDGMNFKYEFIGLILQKAEYDSGDCAGTEANGWRPGDLTGLTTNVASTIRELLGVDVHQNNIKLFSFTHWK